MNTLGKNQEKKDWDYRNNKTLPTIIRNDVEDISLFKSLMASVISHVLLFLLIYAFTLLLGILNINLFAFKMPEKKMKDIEFVIVNKPEQKPINPKTKFRSDRNSRAGGKHNPKRKIRSIDKPNIRSKKSNPMKKAAPKKKVAPKKIAKKQKSIKQAKPARKQVAPKRVAPPKVMPKVIPAVPARPLPSAFPVPAPVVKAPKVKIPTGGPVTSGPITTSAGASRTPAPMMSSDAATAGSYSPYTSDKSSRTAYSMGDGNYGNPSPGNPTGGPGIDALKEPDFGPYMRELQRRIKRNWEPPRGNRSKRVVLLFRISKDGRLLDVKVHKSSGAQAADRAAIEAVELTAPFRPLPPEYRGKDIDIQFTFDYNVFGVGGRNSW